MKVRWTSRSLRLRITPEELRRIQNREFVSERLVLDGTRLWEVVVQSGVQTLLSSSKGSVVLCLSPRDVELLCEPEREGVYFSEGDVRYYIEKDFPCAHPRAGEAEEAPTETFAPPAGFEERKNQ